MSIWLSAVQLCMLSRVLGVYFSSCYSPRFLRSRYSDIGLASVRRKYRLVIESCSFISSCAFFFIAIQALRNGILLLYSTGAMRANGNVFLTPALTKLLRSRPDIRDGGAGHTRQEDHRDAYLDLTMDARRPCLLEIPDASCAMVSNSSSMTSLPFKS